MAFAGSEVVGEYGRHADTSSSGNLAIESIVWTECLDLQAERSGGQAGALILAAWVKPPSSTTDNTPQKHCTRSTRAGSRVALCSHAVECNGDQCIQALDLSLVLLTPIQKDQKGDEQGAKKGGVG
eukprot:CAMPEP_0174311762 /NCGR_PEP_ID=MMETSP0810-20121108/3895_1 /TAXON_ID=73025 ORGANISM="Eutreptiella gymnastica-like, Strain CCMP1594" /NCGR_SAMPLE_ID=MMETSP0810 /ASSEMBLY_ACC=CAM_ASM_000659 /LENGTH=125 /DNA_ID=CAMNT_0015420041 /DNA_START=820 /DNA_END=1193 /DNA_ORIENTATION=+